MYDLAIIGGGPAGYVAAEKAAKSGLRTVLFEKDSLGGVCLNVGCIPTKTLLYSAKLYDNARGSAKYGVTAEGVSLDLAAVMKRKTKVVKKLTGGVRVRLRDAGVEVVAGSAHIVGREDDLVAITCGESKYEARNLLICTGSSPFVPPVPGFDGPGVMTSTEALELDHAPESVAIVGGGVIGMEFASWFSSIGSRVEVVEMQPEILGALDDGISALLRQIYSKKGVSFHLGCRVVALSGDGELTFVNPEGAEESVKAETVLVCVGRKANLQGYGLENLGVATDRGIIVDSRMRTSVPGVYAAGDVTGFSMLAHTASREAEVAVADILGRDDEMKYNAVPGVVYTNPEVASVGLSAAQAEAQGIDYALASLPMQYSGRFVAENEAGEGVCRIVASKPDGRILGVHMIGSYSGEIVGAACTAIERGMTAAEFQKVVLPHPSVSEILKETLFELV